LRVIRKEISMPGLNMKMVQQMQNRILKIQQELAETIVEGTAGGGVVTARVTGAREFEGIKIDPSAVDPEDVEMLEDLISAAIRDAMTKAAALGEEKMGALTGGMKIPGLT
jgi:DNA-binding YbaB/EbfC family protein